MSLMKLRVLLSSCAAVLAANVAVGCGPLTPDEFDEIAAEVYCENNIKQLVRDPDSYQFISAQIVVTHGEYDQYGTAIIRFRSKNGFGGYVTSAAVCESYDNGGERWFKAKLR